MVLISVLQESFRGRLIEINIDMEFVKNSVWNGIVHFIKLYMGSNHSNIHAFQMFPVPKNTCQESHKFSRAQCTKRANSWFESALRLVGRYEPLVYIFSPFLRKV